MAVTGKNIVLVEIETAIRHQSWATAQVGQKSLQTVTVDLNSKKLTQSYTTGKTNIGPIPVGSIRDEFELVRSKFGPSGDVSFSVKGETASAVGFMPNINYKFAILLSLSPRLVTVTGSHDGYPSYNIAVNGKSVYDYVQGHLGQLFGDSDVSVLRKSVPWT